MALSALQTSWKVLANILWKSHRKNLGPIEIRRTYRLARLTTAVRWVVHETYCNQLIVFIFFFLYRDRINSCYLFAWDLWIGTKSTRRRRRMKRKRKHPLCALLYIWNLFHIIAFIFKKQKQKTSNHLAYFFMIRIINLSRTEIADLLCSFKRLSWAYYVLLTRIHAI